MADRVSVDTGQSERAALVARIEAMTNASVSTRPPVITRSGRWKALAHGGSCGLRGVEADTELAALERLLASVVSEPGIPTL
jgi:hypothetical protein